MNTNLVVGDKNQLAIVMQHEDSGNPLGRLFLYVDGCKFGFDNYDYDVEMAIDNVLDYFSPSDVDFNGLLKCPLGILISAYELAFERLIGQEEDCDLDEDMLNHKVNSFYPNFFRYYLTSDDLDDCVFRLGAYMMDSVILLVFPCNKNDIRICAKDEVSEKISEIIINKQEFIDLWRDLKNLAKKRGLI